MKETNKKQKLRIKKGDNVKVISGDDKGLTGRVLEIYPAQMRILVEGANIHKKHTKPNPKNQRGGIVDKELPVHYSNVMLTDTDGNPTRIGIRRDEDGDSKKAIRYAKSNDKDL
jgi:large subunit ribosomal protein L24